MSLRAFHIIFVIASVLLCVYVGLYAIRNTSPILGTIFFIAGAALAIYGKKAFTKLRELP